MRVFDIRYTLLAELILFASLYCMCVLFSSFNAFLPVAQLYHTSSEPQMSAYQLILALRVHGRPSMTSCSATVRGFTTERGVFSMTMCEVRLSIHLLVAVLKGRVVDPISDH